MSVLSKSNRIEKRGFSIFIFYSVIKSMKKKLFKLILCINGHRIIIGGSGVVMKWRVEEVPAFLANIF